MEFGTAEGLCRLASDVGVYTCLYSLNIFHLVKRDSFRRQVLYMPNSTVCEIVPLNLQLAKFLFNLLQYPDDGFTVACVLLIAILLSPGDPCCNALQHYSHYSCCSSYSKITAEHVPAGITSVTARYSGF